ncbi:MAG: DUF4062 domain-containing protein [Thermoplasmata archaeon]
MATVKVFISSLMSELGKERAIVEQAVAELDLLPNRFETWPAGPEDARTKSLAEVADSEIFVLILGSTISEPVLAEYEAARETIPERILVFVKEVRRSPEAEEFLGRLREECVYKTYGYPRKLASLVQRAIRSLMRNLLKRKDEPTIATAKELVVDETIMLKPGDQHQWEFEVEEGDYLNGIVDEADGDPLDIYLMDRGNYVRWKNGERFEYEGDEGVGGCEFESVYVEDDGIWYLVLRNPARVYEREVRVELARLRFG